MSVWGRVAVAGVFEHPTRFAPDKTAYQIHAESARGALADAGLEIGDVDGFFTSGVGPIGILSLAQHLNLRPCHLDSQAIGGSSFVSHCVHAAAAIAGGLCEVALVTYGSTASSERFAIGTGGGGLGDPPDHFEVPFGPTIVGSYALVAQRHMHEYGTTSEQLAEIAVTMRRHAAMNPHAKYRDPITVEDVLASRVISSPLHLLDCCIISDSGGAVVLTSLERARDLARPPVVVLGGAEAVQHHGIGRRDLLEIAAHQSGPLALARGRHARRRRLLHDLRLLHHHRAGDAGGARLLLPGRVARSAPVAASVSVARCRSTPTAAGCRPIIPACAACFSSSRPRSSCVASAVRRRCPTPRSRWSTARAGCWASVTAA